MTYVAVTPENSNLKGCLKVKTLTESLKSTKRRKTAREMLGAVRFASEEHSSKSTFDETKELRFSTIEIREYPICVGDCPTLTGGPPVTIDWSHTDTLLVNVDDYEKEHPSRDRVVDDDLMLPALCRYERLIEAGYTEDELCEATRLAEILARQRTGYDYGECMW